MYITAAVLQGALGNFAWSCLFDQTVEFCSKNSVDLIMVVS